MTFHCTNGETWQTVEDVFKTLDSLSIMTRDGDDTSENKEKIYPRLFEKKPPDWVKSATKSSSCKEEFKNGFGRGALIREIEKEHVPGYKDAQLHSELRGIIKYGFSNELIEENWAPETAKTRFTLPPEHNNNHYLPSSCKQKTDFDNDYEKLEMVFNPETCLNEPVERKENGLPRMSTPVKEVVKSRSLFSADVKIRSRNALINNLTSKKNANNSKTTVKTKQTGSDFLLNKDDFPPL